MGSLGSWLFGDLKRQADRDTAFFEEQSRVIEALAAWRPIGTEVSYLGRTMRVIGHEHWQPFGLYGCARWPELRLRYADDRGEVHELSVRGADLVALMTEQTDSPNHDIEPR